MNWTVKNPKEVGIDPKSIENLFKTCGENHTMGIVIIRHGSIIGERYWGNVNKNTEIPLYSAGRTIFALVIGALIQKGLIKNVNEKIADISPSLNWKNTNKDQITIKHLMSMTSGLSDPEIFGDVRKLEKINEPGTVWRYNGWSILLFDIIFKDILEQQGIRYDTGGISSRHYIFDIMNLSGIDFHEWDDKKFGPLAREKGFNPITIVSRHRSFAAMGQLILNEGRYNEKQIISKDFIKEMLSSSQNLYPGYGYYCWLNCCNYRINLKGKRSEGKKIIGCPNDAALALGVFGRFMMIVPSLDLVVVRFGDYSTESMTSGYIKIQKELAELCNSCLSINLKT